MQERGASCEPGHHSVRWEESAKKWVLTWQSMWGSTRREEFWETGHLEMSSEQGVPEAQEEGGACECEEEGARGSASTALNHAGAMSRSSSSNTAVPR